MQTAQRRLLKELRELYKLQPSNCCAWPINGDLMMWEASISGLRNTPYYLGIFKLRLKFNHKYPFVAPRVNFTTKIYHCNVDYDGYICWDLLSSRWTPLYTVSTILKEIRALIREPNVDDPCDELMAALYRDNRMQYNNNAINWTLRHAILPSATLPPLILQCKADQDDDDDDDDEDDEDEEDDFEYEYEYEDESDDDVGVYIEDDDDDEDTEATEETEDGETEDTDTEGCTSTS